MRDEMDIIETATLHPLPLWERAGVRGQTEQI
jgi:hypothetical protein